MKKNCLAIAISSILPVCAACGSSKVSDHSTSDNGNLSVTVESTLPAMDTDNGNSCDKYIPKAVIYKTNGNYDDNVPVNLDASGTRLANFPATSDITENSTPIKLADGFLLDRRGISYNTAFLNISYKEYAALSHTPSPKKLMKMIIPGAKVTEIIRLPMTTGEAMANIAAVDSIIKVRTAKPE